MSELGWKLLVAATLAIIVYETVEGWRTGRINYRALDGDRKESPRIYWFLMGMNAILIVGCVLAVLGIYGQPF